MADGNGQTKRRFLNVKEVAADLDVTPAWVYRRVRDPKTTMPFIRFGRKGVRFPREEFEAWINRAKAEKEIY